MAPFTRWLRTSRSSRRSAIARSSPRSSSLWDYLSRIGDHDLWRSFLRLQPNLDQTADGLIQSAHYLVTYISGTFAGPNRAPFSGVKTSAVDFRRSSAMAFGAEASHHFSSRPQSPGRALFWNARIRRRSYSSAANI